jgi:hypothetical protein
VTGLSPDALIGTLKATATEQDIVIAKPTQDVEGDAGGGGGGGDDPEVTKLLDGMLASEQVRKMLRRGNDRSTHHQAFVMACVSSGLGDENILELVKHFKPSTTKYAGRLAAETVRSIAKAREDYAKTGGNDDDGGNDDGPTMRARLLTLDQLANMPPPTPLVENLLDLDNTGIIYGRRGSFKSFLALDLALSVASGIRWQTRAVTQGTVVYLAAEGVSGVHQRVAAWQHQHPEATPGDRFLILAESVNLLNRLKVEELAETCAEVGAVLVIVDTLARCLVGGDENSAKDVGIAVEALDVIRRRTGAHVCAVHHSGKDAKAGARGSSAIEAAADTVLEVSSAEQLVTLTTTKQKNRAEGEPIRFRAEPTLDSVVLLAAIWSASSDDLTRKDIEALEALEAIAGTEGVAFGAWAEAADEVGVSRTSVRRLRKKALDMALIEVGPNGTKAAPRYRLTDDGRAKVSKAGN